MNLIRVSNSWEASGWNPTWRLNWLAQGIPPYLKEQQVSCGAPYATATMDFLVISAPQYQVNTSVRKEEGAFVREREWSNWVYAGLCAEGSILMRIYSSRVRRLWCMWYISEWEHRKYDKPLWFQTVDCCLFGPSWYLN